MVYVFWSLNVITGHILRVYLYHIILNNYFTLNYVYLTRIQKENRIYFIVLMAITQNVGKKQSFSPFFTSVTDDVFRFVLSFANI